MQRVFLIDDDLITHFIFENLLTNEDIELHTFESAKKFLAQKHDLSNSIILMDVNMPEIDGLELWSLINERYQLETTKCIIFTNSERVKSEFRKVNSNLHFIEKHDLSMEVLERL